MSSFRRDSRVPVNTKMEKMFQNHYTGSPVEPRGPGVACFPMDVTHDPRISLLAGRVFAMSPSCVPRLLVWSVTRILR